ncbi:MAG: tetratricopeptide repeat protein [Burkholderiaceae bacterium]|nr:tetratricopeptide repeat protein [Burkholderiaceae bacterium]
MYGSDEEQVEALKTWWKENGSSLITGVLLALVVFFGVRQWQSWREGSAAVASDLYQQMSNLAVSSVNTPVTDEQLGQAEVVYGRLKSEFENSVYSRYAALAMAKFLVEKGDEARAATELQWILDHPDLGLLQKPEDALLMVARLRLARVKLSLGDAAAALALLREVEPGDFTASYSELEGDILLEQGNQDGAKAAYLRALLSTEAVNPVLLQLKLQELGVSPADLPVPPSAVEAL